MDNATRYELTLINTKTKQNFLTVVIAFKSKQIAKLMLLIFDCVGMFLLSAANNTLNPHFISQISTPLHYKVKEMHLKLFYILHTFEELFRNVYHVERESTKVQITQKQE